MIPFFLLITGFRNFEDPEYHKINVWGTLSCIKGHKNLFNIFTVQFIMRLFFSLLVIYMPIYLHTVIGFDFAQIGTMTAIILLPYALIEYPAGRIADKYIGEQELLILGFLLGGMSTVYLSFIVGSSFVLWTAVLFIGRAGMSLVEIMSESYFFKHVDENDSNTIRFFRITRPLAYVIGPLLGTIIVALFSIQYLWVAAGLILFSGILYARRLEDTK
jgi:MFS family permease